MTHSLPDKPEVLAISQQLGITRFEVVGRLHILWRWFDTQTDNGHAKSVTSVTLSSCLFGDELGTKFVQSLKNVGWLVEDESGVFVPNFDYHISESAKTRAQSKNRKENQRKRDANKVTDMSRDDRDNSVTREEKRREEVTPIREPIGFAEFWSAYPKKIGKGAAESAWKKHKPDLATVLASLATQKNSDQWKKDNGQFIPNPATWLNQKRWDDVPVEQEKKPFDNKAWLKDLLS